jgi:hypothetical protein
MQSDTPKRSRPLHDTVIRVYDSAGNVIKTHEHNVYPNGIVKYIKVKNDQNPS